LDSVADGHWQRCINTFKEKKTKISRHNRLRKVLPNSPALENFVRKSSKSSYSRELFPTKKREDEHIRGINNEGQTLQQIPCPSSSSKVTFPTFFRGRKSPFFLLLFSSVRRI